jgi:hypothetical protein
MLLSSGSILGPRNQFHQVCLAFGYILTIDLIGFVSTIYFSITSTAQMDAVPTVRTNAVKNELNVKKPTPALEQDLVQEPEWACLRMSLSHLLDFHPAFTAVSWRSRAVNRPINRYIH